MIYIFFMIVFCVIFYSAVKNHKNSVRGITKKKPAQTIKIATEEREPVLTIATPADAVNAMQFYLEKAQNESIQEICRFHIGKALSVAKQHKSLLDRISFFSAMDALITAKLADTEEKAAVSIDHALQLFGSKVDWGTKRHCQWVIALGQAIPAVPAALQRQYYAVFVSNFKEESRILAYTTQDERNMLRKYLLHYYQLLCSDRTYNDAAKKQELFSVLLALAVTSLHVRSEKFKHRDAYATLPVQELTVAELLLFAYRLRQPVDAGLDSKAFVGEAGAHFAELQRKGELAFRLHIKRKNAAFLENNEDRIPSEVADRTRRFGNTLENKENNSGENIAAKDLEEALSIDEDQLQQSQTQWKYEEYSNVTEKRKFADDVLIVPDTHKREDRISAKKTAENHAPIVMTQRPAGKTEQQPTEAIAAPSEKIGADSPLTKKSTPRPSSFATAIVKKKAPIRASQNSEKNAEGTDKASVSSFAAAKMEMPKPMTFSSEAKPYKPLASAVGHSYSKPKNSDAVENSENLPTPSAVAQQSAPSNSSFTDMLQRFKR